MADKELRKTTVVKTITRKYNLGDYENIDISVQHQQEIEWENIDERNKKTNILNVLLLKDFENTRNDIFEKLSKNDIGSKKDEKVSKDLDIELDN
jgi:hypothetical protein